MTILQDNVHTIAAASERISNIVANLKSFARLDEAEFQKTSLVEGIKAALTLVNGELGNRIRLVEDFGDIPRMFCRPRDINQAFMVILTNAVEAIESAGTVTVVARVDGVDAVVKVTDTGRGMSEETVATLFELGFSKRRERVGMRMGLPMSHNIIKEHGGDLDVTSTVGKGTEVTIRLPLNAENPE